MRQTSRAVALLLALEGASAAIDQVKFVSNLTSYNQWNYPSYFQSRPGGAANSVSGRVSSRTAPYNSCPGWTVAAGCAASNVDKVGNWIAYAPTKSAVPTAHASTLPATTGVNSTLAASCVSCIQNNAVWCSRTFSWNIVTGTTLQQNNSDNTKNIMSIVNIHTSPTDQYDNGSCCGVKVGSKQINSFAASISAVIASEAIGANAANLLFNTWSCVAFSSGPSCTKTGSPAVCSSDWLATFEAVVIDIVTTAQYGSWWCTNGLYLQTVSTGNPQVNSKALLPDGANQRYELALVGCPQIQTECGGVNPLTAIAANTAAIDIKTLKTANKCTMVGWTNDKPPAFQMKKGTTNSKELVQTTNAGWVIHHMEYNNMQLKEQVTTGYGFLLGAVNDGDAATPTYALPALDQWSKVPQFTMGQAQYSKQRTWYGAGTSVFDQLNWSSPYQNGAATSVTAYKGKQTYGSVASFDSSVSGTDYTITAGSFVWDGRQVRYTPIQQLINSNTMGTGVATAFNSEKTKYDAAKTLWDNYVALLTKNAKVDAFAAAFSPPKAPTVPPLPAMPWVPAVTQTAWQATPAQVTGFVLGQITTGTDAGQPTSAQFWLADETPSLNSGGGWGSFTAAALTFRDGWGKSYGTIGYEDGTANTAYGDVAQVYDQHWQCGLTAVAGVAGTSCPLYYASAATGKTGVSANNVGNTASGVKFYVAISIWTQVSKVTAAITTNAFGSASGQSEFTLLWSLGKWATIALAAPAAMAAPSAASTLSGVLGAQALVASTAAALATAAALY